ncbi:hypothetical protein [Streptomyces guryensis]|uniref:Uncharacterized protein n=1 Tax=Streptomyces guryensis TaxID=2886947 RepID=A0A9Q3VTL6_9ACTN|nr:hypothetical protein [Streptomyces guryensis]MCD9877927.1 hypothetical protein [Streptomyces guryensis]
MSFEGAVLNGPPDGDGPALLCTLMQAVDFDLTLARPPSGTVDLRGMWGSSGEASATDGRTTRQRQFTSEVLRGRRMVAPGPTRRR